MHVSNLSLLFLPKLIHPVLTLIGLNRKRRNSTLIHSGKCLFGLIKRSALPLKGLKNYPTAKEMSVIWFTFYFPGFQLHFFPL